MNLPNAITSVRIAVAPAIAVLILTAQWQLRLLGWVLYVGAATTDYFDGHLARTRNLVTDLGRLLDPLADKLLLLATLLPMYRLMGGVGLLAPLPPASGWLAGVPAGAVLVGTAGRAVYPFVTPAGLVGLPLWVVLIVLGREAFMTLFRRIGARRGVIISAIGPAKWKTGFQYVWVGAAFFWFFAADLAARELWRSGWWRAFAMFNGIVGTGCMVAAVVLTAYSLALYLRRYGGLLWGGAGARS